MKNTKSTILTAAIFVALLCPVAFADGDMGSGGKTCPEGQTCFAGDTGSAGDVKNPEGVESFLDWVLKKYFDWMV